MVLDEGRVFSDGGNFVLLGDGLGDLAVEHRLGLFAKVEASSNLEEQHFALNLRVGMRRQIISICEHVNDELAVEGKLARLR